MFLELKQNEGAIHGDVNASRPHQRVGDRVELRVTAPFRSKAALQWNGSGGTSQDINTTAGPAGKIVQESTNPSWRGLGISSKNPNFGKNSELKSEIQNANFKILNLQGCGNFVGLFSFVEVGLFLGCGPPTPHGSPLSHPLHYSAAPQMWKARWQVQHTARNMGIWHGAAVAVDVGSSVETRGPEVQEYQGRGVWFNWLWKSVSFSEIDHFFYILAALVELAPILSPSTGGRFFGFETV